jgi:Glycosyl transferase family 4
MSTTVRSLLSEVARIASRHWIFITLVVVGAAIRALATFAYRPAFMFFGDSFSYIIGAQRLAPPNDRPFGYSAFLRLTSYFGDLGLVVVLQHAAGVALAIAVYAVLIKRGAAPWLGAIVTAPLLLDAYLIQIEKNILSETLFATLLVAAVLLVTR